MKMLLACLICCSILTSCSFSSTRTCTEGYVTYDTGEIVRQEVPCN